MALKSELNISRAACRHAISTKFTSMSTNYRQSCWNHGTTPLGMQASIFGACPKP